MRIRTLATAALVLLAACGDDPILPDDLTQAERDLLAEALLQRSLDLAVPANAAGGPGAAIMEQVEFSVTQSATIPCESGSISASATVSGTVDTTAGTAAVDFLTTQTHQACVVSGESGTIRLDGSPNIVNDYGFQISQGGGVTFDGTIEGGISWSTAGDRSGSCTIALSFSGSGNAAGEANASMTGTVCGQGVSNSVTVGG